MLTIKRTSSFKRDYKRESRSGKHKNFDNLLSSVIHYLISNKELPLRFQDHPLHNDWKGYRDCHLRPDLVLIYKKQLNVLTLVRLGSHSELSL